MELHVYHHLADDPATHPLFAVLFQKIDQVPALLAGLESRLGAKYMETVQEMKDQYDALRTNVANQIRQLAEALVLAGTNQAAIDDVTAGIRELNAKLVADDPITPTA